MGMRMSRDDMFMEIAHVVAKRGTCPRASVGAILVTVENKIISIGYNGAPTGEPHCEEVGCKMVEGHCKRSVHAEINAIMHLPMELRVGLLPLTMYVTHKPCENCTKALFRNDIERVVFGVPYRYNGPPEWEEGGVKFEQHRPIYR